MLVYCCFLSYAIFNFGSSYNCRHESLYIFCLSKNNHDNRNTLIYHVLSFSCTCGNNYNCHHDIFCKLETRIHVGSCKSSKSHYSTCSSFSLQKCMESPSKIQFAPLTYFIDQNFVYFSEIRRLSSTDQPPFRLNYYFSFRNGL